MLKKHGKGEEYGYIAIFFHKQRKVSWKPSVNVLLYGGGEVRENRKNKRSRVIVPMLERHSRRESGEEVLR